MTIKQIIDGEKFQWIQITGLEQLTPSKYIVGDRTGIALMEIPTDFSKYLEVGKGIKLVKPGRVDDNQITCDKRFNPMKTKAVKVIKHDQEIIDALKTKIMVEGCENKHEESKLFHEVEKVADNTIIDKLIVYVTTVSRRIESKFGYYRICNLKDSSSADIAVNLYAPHVDKLEANKVYVMKNLKKFTMKTDGQTRLSTIKYSDIRIGSKEEEAVFENVRIADNTVEGTCIMFTNLSCYNACKKHSTKLDEYMKCMGCQEILSNNEMKIDFHCMLQIESEDSSITSVLVFKRHLNIEVENTSNDENEAIIEENIVGKKLKIDYNTKYDDDCVAVKVAVIN